MTDLHKRLAAHTTANRTVECMYCKGTDHKSFECTNVVSIAKRKAILLGQRNFSTAQDQITFLDNAKTKICATIAKDSITHPYVEG